MTRLTLDAHRPNACCDYHRYVADGCCHCEGAVLTCERCENTRLDVAWCDHRSLCTECRAYYGCNDCRFDARMAW